MPDAPVLSAVKTTQIPGVEVKRGKVRDVYNLGDRLMIVATDRISAFDCVLPDPIPDKGRVLTALSAFWFDRLAAARPHHLLGVVGESAPAGFEPFREVLAGRTMLCRKTKVIPIECVARGYLAGSGWAEYRKTSRVCGIALPAGLKQCQALPEPIFTPATKEESGHDENISFERACELVGRDTMEHLRKRTLELYAEGAEYARRRGIILADTKFEFGIVDGEILLIDEILTPDSSRFWPADSYEIGRDQESFDKQYVRNHLQALCDQGKWDKSPPAPPLPADVIAATRARYIEAYERLTERRFDVSTLGSSRGGGA